MIKKVEIKEKEEAVLPKQTAKITSQGKPNLKVIPLGGLEEVGKNMTLLEYDKNIIIIDINVDVISCCTLKHNPSCRTSCRAPSFISVISKFRI